MRLAILFVRKGVEDAERLGESWRANQIGVVASRFVSSRPAARKSAAACSLPGLASSRTNNPRVIGISSPLDGY
jgi:hypothetical protein